MNVHSPSGLTRLIPMRHVSAVCEGIVRNRSKAYATRGSLVKSRNALRGAGMSRRLGK